MLFNFDPLAFLTSIFFQIKGVQFNNQGVNIYASLWDVSTWATQGGKVPLDWTAAPFVASFEVHEFSHSDFSLQLNLLNFTGFSYPNE